MNVSYLMMFDLGEKLFYNLGSKGIDVPFVTINEWSLLIGGINLYPAEKILQWLWAKSWPKCQG